jgi:hypothetical protein
MFGMTLSLKEQAEQVTPSPRVSQLLHLQLREMILAKQRMCMFQQLLV